VDCYRSKVWRTRLDATTNWAVATTGIALSVAFSNAENSPLPRSGGAVGSGVFTRSRNRTPLDALQKREPFIGNLAISTVV
jgi:hypothetical protein